MMDIIINLNGCAMFDRIVAQNVLPSPHIVVLGVLHGR